MGTQKCEEKNIFYECDLLNILLSVKMCGSPKIEANMMSNLTVKPGAKVVFNCKVKNMGSLVPIFVVGLFCSFFTHENNENENSIAWCWKNHRHHVPFHKISLSFLVDMP